jgi:hypothetical protein
MRRVLLSIIFALMLASQPRAAVQPASDKTAYAAEVCGLLRHHAGRNNLPVDFFTRLIWMESIFDAQAVSPAGAEGIAQFMPGTAKLRGLKNSFNHREALAAAADYLAFLAEKFGNLGLAAAAYNFGEEGTSGWLANRRSLPAETEDYVLAITGHAAEKWRDPKAALDIPSLGGSGSFTDNCARLVLREMLPPSPAKQRSPAKPWGVVIAGGFSEAQTLKSFERQKSRYATLLKDELPMVVRTRNLSRGRKLLVRVMIGRNSRQEAEDLCAALRAQNGACFVGKN